MAQLRLIMLGDIVGRVGRLAVMQQIPLIRERWKPDLLIANAENAANGSGLTPDQYDRLVKAGLDGMTLGDHVYKKKQITSVLERADNITRPANLPAAASGKRWMKLTPPPRDGQKLPPVYVMTVLGRIFMNLPAADPFVTVQQILDELPKTTGPKPIVLVEIHAEATSEKIAIGWHFNEKVAAVVGTHTHVATADARILPPTDPIGRPKLVHPRGTAYISDLGMCGPHQSILGRRIDRVLTHMTTSMPAPFDVAEDDARVCGVVIDIDTDNSCAVAIERLELNADPAAPPFVAEQR